MYLFVIICAIILIIAFIYILNLIFKFLLNLESYKNQYKAITHPKMNKNVKHCIILTTTVTISNQILMLQKDKQKRLGIYLKSINEWLKDPNLYVVIVENSGYEFKELKLDNERHEIVSFKYDDLPESDRNSLINSSNKGLHETYSINYAIKNSKIIKNLNDDDMIIKLTGRYFIPNFYEIISNIENDTKICIQGTKNNFMFSLGMRCEMIACRKYLTDYIFKHNFNESMYAELLYLIKIRNVDHVKKLAPMKISPTTTGGFESYFDSL